jgi:hypothetical protein
MRSMARISLVAVATSFLATVNVFAQSNPPDASGWAQHWAADHQALLNAKLAGLKAGLQLTPDQRRNYGGRSKPLSAMQPRCACNICRR